MDKCGWCDRTDAITVVNGTGACADHIGDALAPVGAQIKQIRRLAGE